MGWFLKSLYKDNAETIFSSPSGDGLVRVKNAAGAVVITIFVPEWGWVGSKLSIESMRATRNFRPRFGMGWFLAQEYSINWTPRFSSPSGDGLVLARRFRIFCLSLHFRPRVGMGWFRECTRFWQN